MNFVGHGSRTKLLSLERATSAPVILLFFLPAISVELLSGNTPLAMYTNPFAFVTLNVIYGGGAILIRETVVRWNKGFASIVLFGVAYGAVNEGLTSKGYFDPHFYSAIEMGLQNVGRFIGINVAWAFSITAFHAMFSVAVPILLVDALYPGRNRWLGDESFVFLLALFCGIVALAYDLVNVANNPSPGTLAAVLAFIVLCSGAAWAIPDVRMREAVAPRRPIALFGFGALFAFGVIFAGWAVYRLFPSLALHVGILSGVVTLFAWSMVRLPPITGRSQVVLVGGLLTPMIVSAAIHRLLIPEALVVALLVICWIISKAHVPPTSVRYRSSAERKVVAHE